MSKDKKKHKIVGSGYCDGDFINSWEWILRRVRREQTLNRRFIEDFRGWSLKLQMSGDISKIYEGAFEPSFWRLFSLQG